jgi:putative transposase
VGYRRIHRELASLAIKLAPSTVWEILKTHGVNPAPRRAQQTWATFLRSQAHAILAADFFQTQTQTLTGTRLFILAVIEHTTRRIRILGATPHPTAAWTTQQARNLVMDLQDAGATAVRYLIWDRDSKYSTAFDTVPRRQRNHHHHHRHPYATHERDHGTLYPHLQNRTPRPHPHR